MRSKGPIWEPVLQRLIVDSYLSGKVIEEIMSLPQIQALSVSTYSVRSVLKANEIQPTNKRRKRKQILWSPQVVESIITERNYGHSINEILENINRQFPDIDLKRSTLVRILEENDDKITFRYGDVPDIWNDDVIEKVVELYKEGVIVAHICKNDVFRGLLVKERAVRNILKSEGVQLTGKKGTLRRWSSGLQQRIVHLYQEGFTFEEIKAEPEVAINEPTNYAIRNILKQHGITTRRAINFKETISNARYRRYRDGKMNPNEISLVHKHLARIDGGRQLMVERMGLLPDAGIPRELGNSEKTRILIDNGESWAAFYKWAMRYLYGDNLKRHIFETGLEYSRAFNYYRRVLKDGDAKKQVRTYHRLQDCIESMQIIIRDVLRSPLNKVRIKSL